MNGIGAQQRRTEKEAKRKPGRGAAQKRRSSGGAARSGRSGGGEVDGRVESEADVVRAAGTRWDYHIICSNALAYAGRREAGEWREGSLQCKLQPPASSLQIQVLLRAPVALISAHRPSIKACISSSTCWAMARTEKRSRDDERRPKQTAYRGPCRRRRRRRRGSRARRGGLGRAAPAVGCGAGHVRDGLHRHHHPPPL